MCPPLRLLLLPPQGVVAKHGNRGVSSKSGSADLIETMGVNLAMTPASKLERSIKEIGVGFMFCAHASQRHETRHWPKTFAGAAHYFNILGPMTNPAGVPNQVIGVFNKALLRPVAEVLRRMGSRHVLVVASKDGLDEISLASETTLLNLKKWRN